MIRNYAILSLSLLMVIPFLVLDVYASDSKSIEYLIVNENVIDYTDYSNKINNPSNITGDPIAYYGIGPKCAAGGVDTFSKVKHDVNNGSIVLTFTLKNSLVNNDTKVFLVIDNHKSISKPLVQIDDKNKYRVTISPNELSTGVNDISLKVFFFSSQRTISADLAFSSNSSGSPLYYLSNKALDAGKVLKLPNSDNSNVTFSNDTIRNYSGVFTAVDTDELSLVGDVVCKLGKFRGIIKVDMLDNTAYKQSTGGEYQSGSNPASSTTSLLPLSPPDNIPAPEFATLTVKSDSKVTTGYIVGRDDGVSYTHANYTDKPNIGNLFVPNPIKILSNPLFLNEAVLCDAAVESVSQAITNSYVPDLAIPTNIEPRDKDTLTALGVNFFATGSFPQEPCSPDPEDTTKYSLTGKKMKKWEKNNDDKLYSKLITNKEMRVTLNDVADKKPYYFSPRDNVYDAQYIPLCTSTNYDTTDQTLKRDTKMCYGINDNDVVIITKRLIGFYGAAEVVN